MPIETFSSGVSTLLQLVTLAGGADWQSASLSYFARLDHYHVARLSSIRLGKINNLSRFSVLLCCPHAYNEADPGSTEVALALNTYL
jgi:hypothetical protein